MGGRLTAKQAKRARKKEGRARSRRYERPLHDVLACRDKYCVTCWYGAPFFTMSRLAATRNHDTHEKLGVRVHECYRC